MIVRYSYLHLFLFQIFYQPEPVALFLFSIVCNNIKRPPYEMYAESAGLDILKVPALQQLRPDLLTTVLYDCLERPFCNSISDMDFFSSISLVRMLDNICAGLVNGKLERIDQ